MLNRLIFHVKKIKRARMKISVISLTFIPMATSSLGTTIFNSIWGLLMGFLQTIMNGLGTMFGGIFSGFTQSIDIMFQGFGFSLSGYGVYGPMMFVFGIGIALLLGASVSSAAAAPMPNQMLPKLHRLLVVELREARRFGS